MIIPLLILLTVPSALSRYFERIPNFYAIALFILCVAGVFAGIYLLGKYSLIKRLIFVLVVAGLISVGLFVGKKHQKKVDKIEIRA